MPSLNKVMLIGFLGGDPEVRETTRGSAVANLSVATSQRWVDDRTDENRSRTEWHRVVVWGKQARYVQSRLAKGSPVYVEGTLQTREWTDRNGNKRYTTEVRAQRVQPLARQETPQSVQTSDDQSNAAASRVPVVASRTVE